MAPREPLDEQGSRTLVLGLFISFGLYGISFAASTWIDPPWGIRISLVLMLVSVLFLLGWFLAVRRYAFRLGKVKNRAERRAKEHAKAEKEKRMRLNR